MKRHFLRRKFVNGAAGAAGLAWLGSGRAPAGDVAKADKPALLGGTPVHKGGWPGWPQWNTAWEPKIVAVLRSGHWSSAGGGGSAAEFEKAWARLLGAAGCVTTASGTTALLASLYVVGVDAGDEVIVAPFTFIATYNVCLQHKALPVFADTDPDTLTIDPKTIEERITDRTRAILPVHIYGLPCDMDPINAIAKRHGLAVVEDACQAWLAEYKGRKCGTLGDLGCFSFQNSKHIPSGEGGAVTGMNRQLLDRCWSFRNCGRSYGSCRGSGCFTRGTNFRMTHYQAMMLLQQIEKLVADTDIRCANAEYLTAGLKQIPGIKPVRLPADSRPVWHLYAFRIDSKQLNGLSRGQFIRAMRAEGIPVGGCYHEQYYDGLIEEAINSRGYKRLFSARRLKQYWESLKELKGNKEACETTVTLYQSRLLADRSAMDHIIEAAGKVQEHSAELAKAEQRAG